MEFFAVLLNGICLSIAFAAIAAWMLSLLVLWRAAENKKKSPLRRFHALSDEAIPFSLMPIGRLMAISLALIASFSIILTRGNPFQRLSKDNTIAPISFKMTKSLEQAAELEGSNKYFYFMMSSIKAAGLEILTGYSDSQGQGTFMIVTPQEADAIRKNLSASPNHSLHIPGMAPQLLSEDVALFLRDHKVPLLLQVLNTGLKYLGINPLLLLLLPFSATIMGFGFMALLNTLLHLGMRKNLAQALFKREELAVAPDAAVDGQMTWMRRALPFLKIIMARDSLEIIAVNTNKGVWKTIVATNATSAEDKKGRLLFVRSGLPFTGRRPAYLPQSLVDRALAPE